MLTVAKVTGSQAVGYADYLEGKSTASEAGDYYLKDGERVEAPGRWVTGAEAVGADLAGAVAGEQLRTLMEVRRPDTGGPLRPSGSTGEAVAALDATFSTPKSVSAIWALADPDLRARIEAAHETAIDRTLTYAAAQVAMVRQRIDRDTVIHVKPREVIATSWRHTTARVVDGAPDPQLHSHVLLHAAVRKDGQIVAIDSRTWLTHRRELGAAYRTELARELHQLGFQIQRGTGRGGRYFEVDGIPRELLDRWSSRHHQVQEAIQTRLTTKRAELQAIIEAAGPDAVDAQRRLRDLDAHGLSAGEDRFLARATRAVKQPVTQSDLDEAWETTAQQHALTPAEVTRLRQIRGPLDVPAPTKLEARLTELDATVTRSHVRAIAFEHATGLPIRDALLPLAELRDSDRLLTLADQSLTTAHHRYSEQETAELAQRLAAGDVDTIPATLIERHARQLDCELQAHGGRLSGEQRAALGLACGEDQLTVIQGQAGTGKSTVLVGVARAHEDAGQRVVVTSTAALTAQRLANDLTAAGAHPTAYSTVALQHALAAEREMLNPATTIVHDEAALASTNELHAILQAVEDSGARVILIGDPRQSQPVGAGGLWPHVQDAATVYGSEARLTQNLRARDPADARDQALFRNGQVEEALQGYADRDRLHPAGNQAQAEDAALDAAQTDRTAGRQTVVIAQTSNDHLDQLNARAQAIRQQDGQLDDDGIALPGRPYQLHSGDNIQLRASIPHPDGTLRNGTQATITDIDQGASTAEVALIDGRQVTLTREQLDGAQARLAYVQHPFPAQGTTTDTTHLIIAEHATREGTYVALTRARDQTYLYARTGPLDAEQLAVPQIAEHVSRTESDLPSISQPLAHEHNVAEQVDNAVERRPTNEPARPEPVPDSDISQPARLSAISSYREKYGIDDADPRPLGPEPPADAFRQRLDRREAAQQALLALDPTERPRDRTLADELHELSPLAREQEYDGLEPTR